MALQDVFDPAVEPLDHAICLWSHWWREAMLDAEISAKPVELMLSRGRVLAHALGTRQANLLVKFHGIDLPNLPAAARREKWQDFTPPAARRSRRYRGLILHRRFHLIPDPSPR